jgi:hypothetical protein
VRRIGIALCVLAFGCSDFRTPPDLRYARVLAVRAEPPAITAGQRARIELLVSADDGTVAVRPPDRAALAGPQAGRPAAPAAAMALIVQEGDAWFVNAPSDADLAIGRAALGLPADAPLPLMIEVHAALAGLDRVAEKVVLLGAPGANPAITAITVNGVPLGEGGEAVVPATGDVLLAGTALGPATPGGTISFAWFTSFGKVEKYLQPVATLKEQKAGDKGTLLLIARDDHGGVTWRIASLRVQ